MNDFLHVTQDYGFTSVCILSWAVRLEYVMNYFLHVTQVYGFTSV